MFARRRIWRAFELAMWFFALSALLSDGHELDAEFDDYAECLRRSERALDAQVTVKVVTVDRGSDVILPCFTCVSPEDAVEIESTYKPSSGAVGRAFRKTMDFFKWKYDWEWAGLGKRFSQLSSMHRSAAEKVSDRITRFLNRDTAKIALGDRYELLLQSVTANQTGFYRCANRQLRNVVANMYFVEVLNRRRFVSVPGSVGVEAVSKGVKLAQGDLPDEKLKYETLAGDWTQCSDCSSSSGEQTRAVQCVVTPSAPPDQLPATSSWALLFGKTPCSSSLVPLGLRRQFRKLGNDVVYVEHRPCWADCKSQAAVDREVNGTDDLGESRVMDYLPAGEYVFGELLPRLLPPVTRKVVLVVEGDDVVMTCRRIDDVAAAQGVHWFTRKKGRLQFATLDTIYPGRAHFDDDWRLIIDTVQLTDDDEYYCYSSQNVLLSTYHVRVLENKRSREVVELVRILARFVAFLLIFTLIASQLFK